ncbi:MAG: (d)CMP kinase [Phycisphaeraceae bacterium]|nr:(d)CMP kinase [Phycisphaeraceae bacterium]
MTNATGQRDAEHGVIVTIDGPAGTGKSSVARSLARRLGLEFLDTGAMYRAAALAAIEGGLQPSDGAALAASLRSQGLAFDWMSDPPALHLGQRNVMARIRDQDVNAVVSEVAAQPEVRKVMVVLQQQIARAHPRLVTEGRDQGSAVFPEAAVRFYLDADPAVRARRRCEQLQREGRRTDPEEVRRSMLVRDRIDSTRADAPLRVPEGAVVIDTSALSEREVVDRLEQEVRRRIPRDRLDAAAAGGCCR